MKKLLKALGALAGTLVVVIVAAFAFFSYQFGKISEETHPMHPELTTVLQGAGKPDLELGKRIYTVRSGCIDCHGADLSGVKVIDDPAMGTIYGANITPFKTKNMKDEDIARAVRYGVHTSGRSLRVMPSFDFEGMSRDDLVSLIAYVRSVPEVNKPDHVNTFGPIAKVMGSLGKMPVVFPARFVDQTRGFSEKPAEGVSVAFGKYLANACVGCHGAELKGGKIPGGDPAWPPAPSVRMGEGSGWTQASFMEVVKSGVARSTGQKIRVPMPITALQQMNETEMGALWLYLSSLK